MAPTDEHNILPTTNPLSASDRQAVDAALEWHILTTARPNVLVTGSPGAVDDSVAALMPYLARPVCYWTTDTRRRSSGDVKTLVIRDPGALAPDEQQALCAWLDERASSTKVQVVSTTTVPLFPLVETGLFVEALYYKLNALIWRASQAASESAAAAHAGRHTRLWAPPMPLNSMLTRIRAEYLEMPGLQLTLQQVQRLCGVEGTLCRAALEALVDEKFLFCKPNGAYTRLTVGDIRRPAVAKTDLPAASPRLERSK